MWKGRGSLISTPNLSQRVLRKIDVLFAGSLDVPARVVRRVYRRRPQPLAAGRQHGEGRRLKKYTGGLSE